MATEWVSRWVKLADAIDCVRATGCFDVEQLFIFHCGPPPSRAERAQFIHRLFVDLYKSDDRASLARSAAKDIGVQLAEDGPDLLGWFHEYFDGLEGRVHRLYERALAHAVQLGDQAPSASGRPAASERTAFVWKRLRGDTWSIRYRNEEAHLRHCEGLAILGRLLLSQGHSIKAAEAAGLDHDPADFVAEDALDRNAETEYKAELERLSREREDAEDVNDFEALQDIDNQTEAISKQLGAARGTHGRRRKLGSGPDRTRHRNGKAIKLARQKIREAGLKSLDEHLEASLRQPNGRNPGYFPEKPIPWAL